MLRKRVVVPTTSSRIVYLCDWLPPDYGAVGQYATIAARKLAFEGNDVVLGGLSSKAERETEEVLGQGKLKTRAIVASSYEKQRFFRRIFWTIATNTRLTLQFWGDLRRSNEIVFTGSPPLLLHWIAPANLILRKRLIYRITDFHPECLMAASASPSIVLRALFALTLFWRRRIDGFEVLGEDQRVRLQAIGIDPAKIVLKRDASPVPVSTDTLPLTRPADTDGKLLLLYSGNWGVAHDVETFVEAYRWHHRQGSGRFVLWLNAVGANAGNVEAALVKDGLPHIRTKPVPLEELAALLVTPDAHLITLSDAYVGYVLPSKVYGCIASGLPILYVGSEKSDVHLLCSEAPPVGYTRVGVGDVRDCAAALERMADRIQERTLGAGAKSSDRVDL